jgi:hypothetical protein
MAGFAVYVGVTAENFYPGRLGRKAAGKPLPKWFGRLWFFGFATIAVFMGIRSLR